MMVLLDLLAGEDTFQTWGNLNLPITGITHDSRKVKKGDLYVAIRGFKQDGVDYVQDAVARGAAAVLSIHAPDKRFPQLTWVQVKSDRRILSLLASRLYNNPSHRLNVIGVTGTNGKTTTTLLIDAILNRVSTSAWIGTLGMNFRGEDVRTNLTTPEAPDLFEYLSELEKRNCRHVVMEVSSASLSLQRVEDIRFAQGVFTSFSGEHLDFHQTMDNYLEAKLTLFKNLTREAWAVINADDAVAGKILKQIDCPYLTFGFQESADIRPLESTFTTKGITAKVSTPKGNLEISSPLIGRFNLLNIMAAIASAIITGIEPQGITGGIASCPVIPGRAQRIYSGAYEVFIDFAHTDGALQSLLEGFSEAATTGRLIVVFGAGGNKDKAKRPRMGEVATRYADHVIITSDNPRDEDPDDIIDQIVAGIPPERTQYECEVDREKAIHKALTGARTGDVVIIAGKGHEEYQTIRGKQIPFRDDEVVMNWIRRRDA